MIKKLFSIEFMLTATLRLGSMGVGLLLIRLFSGMGHIDEWGKFTLVTAYSAIVMLFTQLGQGTLILKEKEVNTLKMLQIQINSLVLSILPVGLGLLFQPMISNELYYALLLAPIFVWYRNFSFYFQRVGKSRVLFSILNQDVYLQYLILCISLVLLNTSVNVHWYVPLAFGVMFVCPLVYYLLHLRQLPQAWNLSESETVLKKSFPFFIAAAGGVILGWTDTIMLGYFTNEETVGLYSGIFKISSLVTISLTLLNSYIAPRIRAEYASGEGRLKKMIQPFSRLSLVISVISYLTIYLLGEFVFDLMNLPFESDLFHSLLILAFGYVVNAGVGSVGFLLQLTGNHRSFNRIILSALLVNVVLNYLLIPKYAILGAAISSTITMTMWNIMAYISVRNKLGFSTI